MATKKVKIEKRTITEIQKRLLLFQDLFSVMLFDRRALEVRVREKKELAERLWDQMKHVMQGREGVVSGGRTGTSEHQKEMERPSKGNEIRETGVERKKTYAVVISGKGEKQEGVREKLQEAVKDLGRRVERISTTKVGRVVMELASEEDRKKAFTLRKTAAK